MIAMFVGAGDRSLEAGRERKDGYFEALTFVDWVDLWRGTQKHASLLHVEVLSTLDCSQASE